VIGETIKDFKIIRRLGAGGFGEVWMAEQQLIGTQVAIKLLHGSMSDDKQHLQRFFSEAVVVGKIKHAGIVKIFDVGFHEGRAFLIMEFLEGETLSSRIETAGQLPISQVAEIGRQIASILEATHAVRIVHRDLKPDNIYLVFDAELASKERVKVLDFGFAKLGMGLTATGETMGTPAYIAPEQWDHAAQVDGGADVYSLGCILFKMCCGRPPFEAEMIAQWYAMHRGATPPRARSLVPDLPGELDELIARMLSKAPADRPSVRDIGAVLAGLAAPHLGERDPAPPVRIDPARPPKDPDSTLGGAAGSLSTGRERKKLLRRMLLAASAIAVLSVAAAVVVFLATRDDTPGDQLPETPRALADASPAPADAPPAPPKPGAIANRWVRIDLPPQPYLLGVADTALREYVGFRASRGIFTPPQPYEIQEHEVTWSELDLWLAGSSSHVERPPWAADAKERAALPATNLTWSAARDYCRSLGGELPTEEQWEYAARGLARRPNPWGSELLDRQFTHAFAGPGATPLPVMTSSQDQTPGPAHIWDLAGNVQEWTLGLWREDRPGKDESGVQRGQTTVRAIRGLPLAEEPPARIQRESVAFRKRLCATGPCVEKTRDLLVYVGFRCVKSVDQ
jgi:tRNA A-37 threonylcarbamoyl transferase component Bud32